MQKSFVEIRVSRIVVIGAIAIGLAGCDRHYHQRLNEDGSGRCAGAFIDAVEHETWGNSNYHSDNALRSNAVPIQGGHTHPGLGRDLSGGSASRLCPNTTSDRTAAARTSETSVVDSSDGLSGNAVPATLLGVAVAVAIGGSSSSTTGTQ